MSHPWFESINIEGLLSKTVEPPFVPELTDDYENLVGFDSNMTQMSLEDEIPSEYEITKIKEKADAFKEFES